MQVTAIKTAIVKPGEDLNQFLVDHLPPLQEESVVVITSKIISFAQNRLVPVKSGEPSERHALARKEADLYLDPASSKYNIMLSLINYLLGSGC